MTSRPRILLALACALAGVNGFAQAEPIPPEGAIDLFEYYAVNENAHFGWGWAAGTQVTRRSMVVIERHVEGSWRAVSPHLRITQRDEYRWDTRALPERYLEFRARIVGTQVVSQTLRVKVDHTPPKVHITSPDPTTVNGEPTALAVGLVPLQMNAWDVGGRDWGLGRDWLITNETTGQTWTGGGIANRRTHFDFGAPPGRYTLTAIVGDEAGNVSTETITVIGLPGPGTASRAIQERTGIGVDADPEI